MQACAYMQPAPCGTAWSMAGRNNRPGVEAGAVGSVSAAGELRLVEAAVAAGFRPLHNAAHRYSMFMPAAACTTGSGVGPPPPDFALWHNPLAIACPVQGETCFTGCECAPLAYPDTCHSFPSLLLQTLLALAAHPQAEDILIGCSVTATVLRYAT